MEDQNLGYYALAYEDEKSSMTKAEHYTTFSRYVSNVTRGLTFLKAYFDASAIKTTHDYKALVDYLQEQYPSFIADLGHVFINLPLTSYYDYGTGMSKELLAKTSFPTASEFARSIMDAKFSPNGFESRAKGIDLSYWLTAKPFVLAVPETDFASLMKSRFSRIDWDNSIHPMLYFGLIKKRV